MRWVALVALVLLAFGLRLHALDAVPLRGDEAYAAVHWTQTPFSPAWMTMIETEPNPGSLVVYWAWTRGAGETVFALRYLPVLINTLGLAVLAALIMRLGGRRRAVLLGMTLWAVAPFLVWHAQDARQYALLATLTPLNIYLLLRALDSDRRVSWLVYILCQTLTLYMYYVEVFWMAAMGVYVLWRHPHRLKRLIAAWAVVGLLIVPLLAQIYVVTFVSEYRATATSAELSALFTQFLPTLLFGQNTVPLLTGILLAAGVLALAWRHRPARALFLPWVLVPTALLTLVSLRANFFLPRYIVAVTPALLLIIALGVTAFRWRPLALLAGAGFVLVAGGELNAYFRTDAPKAPDWPGLMAYLDDRATPHTVFIFGDPDPAIEYYFDSPGEAIILPMGWYDLSWQDQLDAWLREYDALYLLAGRLTGETGAYLQATAQHIPGDTRPNVIHYRPWDVRAREIQTERDLLFADVARLAGYTVVDDSAVLLYWEAQGQTERELSVLLHLEAADGTVVAVLDHAVAGAVVSTRTWEPGTRYRDPVALPPDLPPGTYTLRVGMYPAGDPESWLAVVDQPAPEAGRYVLGRVVIG